ncbi:hypothetical protein O9929_13120 [Vibrio lentus]|nr:hypothetical protein [Vibrio lentus]
MTLWYCDFSKKSAEADFNDSDTSTFLMVVQRMKTMFTIQHLLEKLNCQKQGVRTVRRTFEQLSCQLSSGDNRVYLFLRCQRCRCSTARAGIGIQITGAPELNESVCLSYTTAKRACFMEQHHVAMNATISQQLTRPCMYCKAAH